MLVIERDAVPSGSTALSSGIIPACATRLQAALGIEDSVERMRRDILVKNHGEADPRIVEALWRASGPAIDWLTASHGIPFVVLQGFVRGQPRPAIMVKEPHENARTDFPC